MGGRALALMAYVALAGPAARPHLAKLLWPRSSDHAARHSLRQTLSSIRAKLGHDPFEGGDPVTLAEDRLGVDVRELSSAIEQPDIAGVSRLVRGIPLDGLDDGISREFEAWVDRARSRLRDEIVEALDRGAATASIEGDHATLERLAEIGTCLGLNRSALHEAWIGPAAPLPSWASAETGSAALSRILLRLRPGVDGMLMLVHTAREAWAIEVLSKEISTLPEGGRPRLILPAPCSRPGLPRVAALLGALLEAPGGAGVRGSTTELVDALGGADGAAVDSRAVNAALEDGISALLDEAPLVIVLPVESLDLRVARLLAAALEGIDTDALCVTVLGKDPAGLQSEPVRLLSTSLGDVRLVRESPHPTGAGTPGHETGAADTTHGLHARHPSRRAWLAVPALSALVLLGVWSTARVEGPIPLLPDHDMVVCSDRGGSLQYYRWVESSGIVERISDRPTDACYGVGATGDSFYLVHGQEGEVVVVEYDLRAPIRADQPGTPLVTAPTGGNNPFAGSLVILEGVSDRAITVFDLSSGDTTSIPGRTDHLAVPAIGHEYPWVLAGERTEGGDIDIAAFHLESGVWRSLVSGPEQEGDGWLSDGTIYFARGKFGEAEDGSLEIWRKDLASGSEERLTSNAWNDYELSLSPDGSHLCWQSERRGHFSANIDVMEVRTGRTWTIVDSPLRDAGCRWTPNGAGLVWTRYEEGTMKTVLRALAGGDEVEVAPYGGYNRPVGFIPRGAKGAG